MGVLLVDDDRGDLMLLREAFHEAAPDMPLLTARTGQAALDAIAEGGVRLVLLDLNMPGMGGFEVLEAIRSDPVHGGLPVIVLTTSAADRDVVAAYRSGANAFITKPAELVETIEVMRGIVRFWLHVAILPGGS